MDKQILFSNLLLHKSGIDKVKKVKEFFSGEDAFLISHVNSLPTIVETGYNAPENFIVLSIGCADYYDINDTKNIIISLSKNDFCTLVKKWESKDYCNCGEFKDLVEVDSSQPQCILLHPQEQYTSFGDFTNAHELAIEPLTNCDLTCPYGHE